MSSEKNDTKIILDLVAVELIHTNYFLKVRVIYDIFFHLRELFTAGIACP